MGINLVTGGGLQTTAPETGEKNLYDVAKPNLDLCSLIYFYTELRSATKKKLKRFADRKNIDCQLRGETPSTIEVLYNQIDEVNTNLENLKKANNAPAAQSKYQLSLRKLAELQEEHDLTDGDVDVFKTYFQIVSKKPKRYTDIKRDIQLYSSYIDPLFVTAFGGKDFHVEKVESLVDLDPEAYLYYIDDDFVSTSLNPSGFINGFDSEVVYAIAVSDATETISVVFRGSVNANDWLTNVQVNSTECKFPGFTSREDESKPKRSFGLVHEGFYKYLFGETEAGFDGRTISKGEAIMGRLMTLKKQKEGYKFVFTGHSLGGALSTMMSARAAALNEINSTIINVSYESPFVGDQAFRESFYEWEKKKSVQHLRMSNFEDIVPLIPFSTFPGPDFHPYKHTGMNIKLFNKSLLHPYHYHLSYPKEDSLPVALRNTLNSNIFNGINVNILNHLLPECSKRLESAKEDLEKLSLNQLYGDSELTGWEYDTPASAGLVSSPEVEGEEKKEFE